MDRSSSIRQRHAAGAALSGARRLRQSIDLRAHGPVLEAMAQSRCTSLAALVRTALADWLASHAAAAADTSPEVPTAPLPDEDTIKVTLRMPPRPVPMDQQENRCALLASTATLAAQCSDLQALEHSLNQARWIDLAACKAVTDPLFGAVSRHLALASSVLTELSASRRSDSHGSGSS